MEYQTIKEKGKVKFVVLPVEEFETLIDRLEDESDLRAIREAQKEPLYDQREAEDYIFMNPDPPGIMVVVDLDGGGRFLGQMTECAEDQITIDLPVELTYRKWHEALSNCHYFWKCRPLDEEEK